MPMCLYRIPAFLLLIFVLPIVGPAQTNLLNDPSLEASDPSLEASDPSLEASEPSSKENLFMVLEGDAAQREWFGGSVLGCWMG